MSSKLVIDVEGLSKAYHIYARPEDRLKQLLLGSRKTFYREFWAMRDVSFQVFEGETVGFLGPNGAGKSTLLQLICGTLTPTLGSVRIDGRISALLELGVGFNPEFTGHENIYLYGAVLGLDRAEIDEKLEEILTFADIGDFIQMPVKTYSSGMLVRLAFSVAINMDPKVLIVDEALAVGDARFSARCMKKLNLMRQDGVTILFVSHDSDAVRRLCTKAFVLDHGSIVNRGHPVDIVNWYQAFVAADYVFESAPRFVDTHSATDAKGNKRKKLAPDQFSPVEIMNETTATAEREMVSFSGALDAGNMSDELISSPESKIFRYGDGKARIVNCRLLDSKGALTDTVLMGDTATFVIDIVFHEDIETHGIGFYIDDRLGAHVIGINTFQEEVGCAPGKAGERRRYSFTFPLDIRPGAYSLSPSVAYNQQEAKWMDYLENAIVFQVIDDEPDRIVFGSYLPRFRKITVEKLESKTTASQ